MYADLYIIALTRPTVKSIIFFGAPHRGLAVTAMQSMVQGTPSEDLIGELKMHSPTLTRLNDGFHRVYEDVSILTIYEMEPTASLCKNGFDTWERSGPPVMMVEKDSAILYWPTETRIGLNQDHSRIAKVERGQNGCYDDICHFLQRSLVSSDKANTVPIVKPPKLPSSDLPSSRKGKIVMGRRLREAIKNGDSETARDLIGKDPHTRVPGNPLSLAVEFCPEIVSTLLDAGANVSATGGEEGGQAIHTAAKHAKSHKIVQLLLDAGADVNARDSIDDKIPLHHAARYNDKPEIVQYLIDAGATVNAPARDRQTPLHSAALWTSNPEVLRVLIDAGATVNARANEGYTPLHAAALDNRNPEVLRVLIDAGATVNASTKEKSTPLHYAALYNSNPEVLRVLIDAGATVNAPGKKKCTPLHYAASYNSNPEILQILIDAGATVNVSDRDGYTSLHCAARWNNSPEVCHELLTAGAPLEQKDSGGYTALHLAVSHGNKAVVVHLLKWGADPRAKSKSGVAPADAAFHESVPPVTRIEIRKLTRSALQV